MACADCGKTRPIMIPMEPGTGRERGPWELCSVCWRSGFHLSLAPELQRSDPAPPPPASAPSTPPAETGDFSRPPPAKPLRPRARKS
jgi:hypothetical protein